MCLQLNPDIVLKKLHATFHQLLEYFRVIQIKWKHKFV